MTWLQIIETPVNVVAFTWLHRSSFPAGVSGLDFRTMKSLSQLHICNLSRRNGQLMPPKYWLRVLKMGASPMRLYWSDIRTFRL